MRGSVHVRQKGTFVFREVIRLFISTRSPPRSASGSIPLPHRLRRSHLLVTAPRTGQGQRGSDRAWPEQRRLPESVDGQEVTTTIHHHRRRSVCRANLWDVKALDIRSSGEDRRRLTGQCLWMRIDPRHGCPKSESGIGKRISRDAGCKAYRCTLAKGRSSVAAGDMPDGSAPRPESGGRIQ